MPPLHRCECISHGCGSKFDNTTGLRGRELPIRTLRQHERDDNLAQSEELQRLALEAQQRSLASLENSMERLSLEHPRDSQYSHLDSPTRTPKYKTDFKKRIIADLSEWKDCISRLSTEVESIGLPPPRCSLQAIQASIAQFHEIQQTSGDISHKLHIVSIGSYRKEASVKFLVDDVQECLNTLKTRMKVLERPWRTLHDLKKEEIVHTFDSSSHFDVPIYDAAPIIQVVSLMAVVCHVLLGFPRRGCRWIFSLCSFVVEMTVRQAKSLLQIQGPAAAIHYFANMLSGFPRDIRTAAKGFRLDGESVIYAMCPRCHHCHKPAAEKGTPVYPQRCSMRQYGSRCGELLLRPKMVKGGQILTPIKPYVVFDFRNWLAGLLSRKGYEEQMDGAWAKLDVDDDIITDIFQGSMIRQFKGPGGKTHFSKAGPDPQTGRYLFSMGCDFFNPLRNLANGKKVSVGIIAIICLNLPITLRYKPENIFLGGIIPGPKEPSLNINPYLRPFVDIFLLFWQGIKFSRTAMHPDGRYILCALVAIICDLPAGRKVGGFASCSHEYFCSVCSCTKTEHPYNDADYNSWTWRTNDDCRAWAEKFRQAPTEKMAASIFDRSGMRWSELLRLPYFDPTKHLVVDPMHNLFLGLLKEHFQNILGYFPKQSKPKARVASLPIPDITFNIVSSARNPLPDSPNAKRGVRQLVSRLTAPFPYDLSNESQLKSAMEYVSSASIQFTSMLYVAKGLKLVSEDVGASGQIPNLPFAPQLKKSDLALLIVNWRAIQQSLPPYQPPIRREYGYIITEDEINELWRDIENMVKPSWATTVPSNISSVCAKLKSDQWRAIGSLYLPVTLIRLWSSSAGDSGDVQDRRQLLHLTMLLCSAVSIITSRTISKRQAGYYLGYMAEYRKELQRLFPGYTCHPNHHMAMHLGEFLQMYGPVHGWWTFPFERMIGRLQRILTNYKPGEYEATIGHSWTRSSNFHSLFSKDTCPEAIRLCAKYFEQLVATDGRNALAESSMLLEEDEEVEEDAPWTTKPLPRRLHDDVHIALQRKHHNVTIPKVAVSKGRITIHGITYARRDVHEGNSDIMAFGSDTPYSITDILEFPAGSGIERFWFIANRHRPANVREDPYADYPHIGAKLWSLEYETPIEVIALSEVETHFAKCAVPLEGDTYAVIISLSKTHVVW